MAPPFDRIKAAWDAPDRENALNRVVEALAGEGATRDELDAALSQLLDEVRATGGDDQMEEVINSVGDRLHGWCHASRLVVAPSAGHSVSVPVDGPATPNRSLTPTEAK